MPNKSRIFGTCTFSTESNQPTQDQTTKKTHTHTHPRGAGLRCVCFFFSAQRRNFKNLVRKHPTLELTIRKGRNRFFFFPTKKNIYPLHKSSIFCAFLFCLKKTFETRRCFFLKIYIYIYLYLFGCFAQRS